MPYYRLVDQETGESVALRRMSHDAANLLNAELGDDQQWKRGLQHEKTSSPPIGTLHQITRSLDTEGFNQHSLQVIERFLNHHSFILRGLGLIWPSTTKSGPIKPWAIGHRVRCSKQ